MVPDSLTTPCAGFTPARCVRIEKQYWNLYDDIETYCQAPTAEQKAEIERDFNHWVTTQVHYADLRCVLGQLYQASKGLLLVLKYP